MDRVSIVIVCGSRANEVKNRIEDLYDRLDTEGLEKDTLFVSRVSDTDLIRQLTGKNSNYFNDYCETIAFEVRRLINLMPVFEEFQNELQLIGISILRGDSITFFDFANNSRTDKYEEIFDSIIEKYLTEAEGVIIALSSVLLYKEKVVKDELY